MKLLSFFDKYQYIQSKDFGNKMIGGQAADPGGSQAAELPGKPLSWGLLIPPGDQMTADTVVIWDSLAQY